MSFLSQEVFNYEFTITNDNGAVGKYRVKVIRDIGDVLMPKMQMAIKGDANTVTVVPQTGDKDEQVTVYLYRLPDSVPDYDASNPTDLNRNNFIEDYEKNNGYLDPDDLKVKQITTGADGKFEFGSDVFDQLNAGVGNYTIAVRRAGHLTAYITNIVVQESYAEAMYNFTRIEMVPGDLYTKGDSFNKIDTKDFEWYNKIKSGATVTMDDLYDANMIDFYPDADASPTMTANMIPFMIVPEVDPEKAEPETKAETETDKEEEKTESDSKTETDTEADANADTKSEADANADTKSETEAKADTETKTGTDDTDKSDTDDSKTAEEEEIKTEEIGTETETETTEPEKAETEINDGDDAEETSDTDDKTSDTDAGVTTGEETSSSSDSSSSSSSDSSSSSSGDSGSSSSSDSGSSSSGDSGSGNSTSVLGAYDEDEEFETYVETETAKAKETETIEETEVGDEDESNTEDEADTAEDETAVTAEDIETANPAETEEEAIEITETTEIEEKTDVPETQITQTPMVIFKEEDTPALKTVLIPDKDYNTALNNSVDSGICDFNKDGVTDIIDMLYVYAGINTSAPSMDNVRHDNRVLVSAYN